MSYQTYFSLEVKPVTDDGLLLELQKALIDLDMIECRCAPLDDGCLDPYGKSAWFSSLNPESGYCDVYDEEVQKLSEIFPELTFKLHSEGEERDDIRDRYYKDGEHEDCFAEIHVPEPENIKWEE